MAGNRGLNTQAFGRQRQRQIAVQVGDLAHAHPVQHALAVVRDLFGVGRNRVLRDRRPDIHVDHFGFDVEFEQRVADDARVGVDLFFGGLVQLNIAQQFQRRQVLVALADLFELAEIIDGEITLDALVLFLANTGARRCRDDACIGQQAHAAQSTDVRRVRLVTTRLRPLSPPIVRRVSSTSFLRSTLLSGFRLRRSTARCRFWACRSGGGLIGSLFAAGRSWGWTAGVRAAAGGVSGSDSRGTTDSLPGVPAARIAPRAGGVECSRIDRYAFQKARRQRAGSVGADRAGGSQTTSRQAG